MNFLHIGLNGYFSKEVTHIGKGFNKKIEKTLERAMIKAYIYEMYFEHGFKRKDACSQTFKKTQPSVLIGEGYEQLKKEENESHLGFTCIFSLFVTSFTFLIMLELD